MKTIYDHEIINTSRGNKKVGGLFAELDRLTNINAELVAALEQCLEDCIVPSDAISDCNKKARAALERAKQ